MKNYARTLVSLAFLLYCIKLPAATFAEECKRLFDEAQRQEAVVPCTQAAEAGDPPSQTMLGELYDEAGNSKEVVHWWTLAAKSGYQPARNLLALKYYYGGSVFGLEEGWSQDFSKAFSIWKEDAERGVAASQFMVGEMYMGGKGVPENLAEAWAWLKLSLENGYKMSTDVLIELSRRITPDLKQLGNKKLAEYRERISKTIIQQKIE